MPAQVGDRVGRLTVVDRLTSVQTLVVCDCGRYKVVDNSGLVSGESKSCGCLRRDLMREKRTKHGKSRTKIYGVWAGMRGRCSSPSNTAYKTHGARGISVCAEWSSSFELFKAWAEQNGYREGLCIDRINNDGNYEPSNCRWVTIRENCNNTRRSRYLTIFGETKTISNWARDPRCHVRRAMIQTRLKNKWPINENLFTPLQGRWPDPPQP